MKQSMCFHLFFLIYCSLSVCGENTICLDQGKLQGSYRILGNYWSYLGVPYAEFKGRFKEPGNPPSWKGTFKANRGTLICKQYSAEAKSTIGEEDCLTLNVYTPIAPTNTSAKPLSVIFFIPGGGFYKGSNTDTLYNARYLVQKDVVVVTINYRVGAFGFLCLKNDGAPGNMGLKDQLAALRWVKSNIACFGGDPNSVTLFGQSAGASSVDYLILTQTAKGLFHRAIMDSGTSLRAQAIDREPIWTASEAASRLGYNTKDTDELLKIYLNATADDVARISYQDTTNYPLAPYMFKPCVEDPNTSGTTIINKDPRELIKSVRDISNISVIIGYNSQEGLYWASEYDLSGLKMLDKNFSTAIPKAFTFKTPESKDLYIKDIREFYFKNSPTNYNDLIDYYSDIMIMGFSVFTMEAYLTNPNISMFNYYFNYDSRRNLVKMMSKLRDKVQGAEHVDELFYLFDPIAFRFLPPIPRDMVMIDKMTSLWTNFAKTGVPSANMSINEWPRSENNLKFLKLDKEINVIDQPNRDRIEFWKRSYARYA